MRNNKDKKRNEKFYYVQKIGQVVFIKCVLALTISHKSRV